MQQKCLWLDGGGDGVVDSKMLKDLKNNTTSVFTFCGDIEREQNVVVLVVVDVEYKHVNPTQKAHKLLVKWMLSLLFA